MNYVASILVAVALSIDGFGVGLAYGIKKVNIKLASIIVITLSSAVVMTSSVYAGRTVSGIVPDYLQGYIGGSILIAIGIWQLIQGWENYQIDKITADIEQPILLVNINLKVLGLVLQILREPIRADLDKSGEISLKEAFLLGLALNIDAFGAGLGAGIAGYSLILIPIVAISLFLAILLGLFIGKKYAVRFLGEKVYILPGSILVLLGIFSILQ